jgi:hypothetical protein
MTLGVVPPPGTLTLLWPPGRRMGFGSQWSGLTDSIAGFHILFSPMRWSRGHEIALLGVECLPLCCSAEM